MSKELMLAVDFADQIALGYEQGRLYGRQRIEGLVRLAAGAGVTGLIWRVSAIGKVTYRSEVRTVLDGTGLPPDMAYYTPAGQIMRECDPLAVAVEAARAQGMKIFPYVTLFDEAYPGLESEFGRRHPEYYWRHRSFDHHIKGLLSYAYPEVRAHRLAEIEELIAYGGDGVYVDVARSHAGIWPVMAMPLTPVVDPYHRYGFNDPEAEAYQQRHGVDPRREPYDDDAWQRLRGEYLTEFLRQAIELVRSRGQRLAVAFYSDAEIYLSPAGQRGRRPLGRFYHDWPAWVQQALIDDIVIIAEHRRFGDEDWANHSGAQFTTARQRGTKVHIWAATESRIDEMKGPPAPLPISFQTAPEFYRRTLGEMLGRCVRTDADGVLMYEAAPIERDGYWDTIRRVADLTRSGE